MLENFRHGSPRSLPPGSPLFAAAGWNWWSSLPDAPQKPSETPPDASSRPHVFLPSPHAAVPLEPLVRRPEPSDRFVIVHRDRLFSHAYAYAHDLHDALDAARRIASIGPVLVLQLQTHTFLTIEHHRAE